MGDTQLQERPRSPMLIACRQCNHVWPVVWMPCSATLLGKVSSAARYCPWCGNTKKSDIRMANVSDIDRYAAWLETELMRARAEAMSYARAEDAADG
jgi:transcription elongation factor Elf1